MAELVDAVDLKSIVPRTCRFESGLGYFIFFHMSLELLNKPMSELLSEFPSMKRALFSSFHIGGCQSCAYKNDETLSEVCERNEISAEEAVSAILESAERDSAMMVTPMELKALLKEDSDALLLDCRTREEYDAV